MILLIFGLLMVAGGFAMQFLLGGGAFYRMYQAMNSTFYSSQSSTFLTQWDKHYGFMTTVYWIAPIIMVAGILLIIFALAQRREYYTSGGVIG